MSPVRPILRRQSHVNLQSALINIYGDELDDMAGIDGGGSAGAYAESGRTLTVNLTEMDKTIRHEVTRKLNSDPWFSIPKALRLDFDFYRIVFLHMRNDNFHVSTMQVLLCFERLARLIAVDLPQSVAKTLLSLQNEQQMVSWDKYVSYIDANEQQGFPTNRIRKYDEAEFSLEADTSLELTTTERVFLTLEDSSSSKLASWLGLFRVAVVLLSTISIILDSEPSIKSPPDCGTPPCLGEPVPPSSLADIEFATIIAFTVDFVSKLSLVGFVRFELMDRARLVDMAAGRKRLVIHKTFWNRIGAYLVSIFSIVDVVSILPYFIKMGLSISSNSGLQVFRIFRLANIVRLMKLKQFRDIRVIIFSAFSKSLVALGLLLVSYIIVVLFFGVLIYFQEMGNWYPLGSQVPGLDNPSVGAYYRPTAIDQSIYELSPFKSVLLGVWFSIVTSATVGYGDMVPSSTLGKFIASILVMAGVVIIALPIAIIGSNFTTEYKRYFAIRNLLAIHKDRKIQNNVLSSFIAHLTDEDKEVREQGMIFDSTPFDVSESSACVDLKNILAKIEGGETIISRVDLLSGASSTDDIQELMYWSLTDLEHLKETLDVESYRKAKQYIIAISILIINKVLNNSN